MHNKNSKVIFRFEDLIHHRCIECIRDKKEKVYIIAVNGEEIRRTKIAIDIWNAFINKVDMPVRKNIIIAEKKNRREKQ